MTEKINVKQSVIAYVIDARLPLKYVYDSNMLVVAELILAKILRRRSGKFKDSGSASTIMWWY